MKKIPKPGDIFYLTEDRPCQIVTIGIHKETCEYMVVYQILFGDFKTYVLPLSKFMNEIRWENIREFGDSFGTVVYGGSKTDAELENGKKAAILMNSNIAGNDNKKNDFAKSDVTKNDIPESNIAKSGISKSDIKDNYKNYDNINQNNINSDIVKNPANNDVHNDENNYKVDNILLKFLNADSYAKKLEIVTTNIKSINDRMINDMAASLDCMIEEGPLDLRVQELIYCLRQMSRFEDRRLR